MEPLSEWYRANNEAYQGIFIDEHHIGQWQGAMRPQLGQDRDQVGFMVMSQKSNFELAHQSANPRSLRYASPLNFLMPSMTPRSGICSSNGVLNADSNYSTAGSRVPVVSSSNVAC